MQPHAASHAVTYCVTYRYSPIQSHTVTYSDIQSHTMTYCVTSSDICDMSHIIWSYTDTSPTPAKSSPKQNSIRTPRAIDCLSRVMQGRWSRKHYGPMLCSNLWICAMITECNESTSILACMVQYGPVWPPIIHKSAIITNCTK